MDTLQEYNVEQKNEKKKNQVTQGYIWYDPIGKCL